MDGARTWIQSVLDGDSQHGRLLTMDFPRGDGPEYAVLLVNSLHAREELSRSFRYEAELLSDDAHIALTAMMGKMVTISLVRDDGSQRHFNGYVTEFCLLGADGGLAKYRMVLEPWMAFTRLRQDCFSFHGRTVREITELTLRHCVQHDWKTNLCHDDPALTCANQYNETDYNHLHRRWEARGWFYWYEHRANGHTLWLSDSSELANPIDARAGTDAPDGMPFRSEAGAQEDDSIHQWQAVRRMGASKLTLSTFDYKDPRPQQITAHTRYPQGAVPEQEVHEYAGARAFRGWREGEPLAQRRSDGREAMYQLFEASGNDRGAQPGRRFKLEEHFSGDAPRELGERSRAERNYLILSVEHHASNNYQDGRHAQSRYTNHFTCIRLGRRWAPGLGYHSTPCPDPGVQTAIVAGPEGEEIHTDGLGRIKLRFHWDRIGGVNGCSSPWMRVVMPVAGSQFGQIGLPRVGQEVVVQFMNGNVDHPIVTGVVYNGTHGVPWALPEQKALSGWRSREIGGSRGNQLVMDDTRDQLQAQLRSDHLHSQLALGHIVRVESTAGRGEARGDGFELRTDGCGVVRAGRGMLVTTEEQAGAASHVKNMGGTLRQLATAGEVHRKMAEEAQRHGALDALDQQGAVAQELKKQQEEVKGNGGNACPELTQPHLVLAGAAGVETVTPQSTHIASGEHTALSAGQNVSLAAGRSLFASVRETLRVFVHKAGMKLIAAAGKVSVRAESDDVEVVAQKVLTLLSESDWVDIRGRKGVRLHGGDCMVEISDLVQFFTPKPTLFHGNLETLGPKNRPQPEPEKKETANAKQRMQVTLLAHPDDSEGLANVPYALYKGDALIQQSLTDSDGGIEFEHEDGVTDYRIELPNGAEFALKVHPKLAAQGEAEYDEHVLSNLGRRATDDTTQGRKHE
jgi:type VI secretion system secreted protein VgrG